MRELGEGIRRIYELMRQNDLTEPDLSSDATTFRIALHHRFIYPQEVKLWVDAFAEHELTRDEKTVVRLGYDGHVISPQEIWDAVGIVDTDYYRQLLEALREKNLLHRKVPANKAFQIAKNKKTSKKRIPQFGIRNPSQAKSTKPDQQPADTMEYAKVFVGNIPFDATEESISEAFGGSGEVVDVAIPVNPQTERPRGFAFVEFATNIGASQALADTGRIQLGGRRLYIQQYIGRRRSGQARD
jgi:ATP-dependent DNA helicase RecG